MFSCTYEGSVAVPTWRINEQLYTWSSLPDRHIFNGKGLRIKNVDVSMNGTNYQCIIPGVGQSTVGILIVLTEIIRIMSTTSSRIVPSYTLTLSSSIVTGIMNDINLLLCGGCDSNSTVYIV